MVRNIDTSQPLSAEDVEYLRSRHSDPYVDRMILLAGGASASPAQQAPDLETGTEGTEQQSEPESGEQESGEPQGQPDPSEAENEAEDDEDDLIGAPATEEGEVTPGYSPFDFTTREVRAYMKKTTVTERERVRSLEETRSDGVDPRSSITNYHP